jgi:hypothetical protein
MTTLDMEIREEMTIGLDGLDRKYSHLFSGTVRSRLKDGLVKKRMWIMNVWAAWDNNEHEYARRHRNEVVTNIYNRWRKRSRKET